MNNDTNYWVTKLIAFLHDPPNKALDIRNHEEVRKVFFRQAGLSEDCIGDFDKKSDFLGASADRFPFPDHKKTRPPLVSNFSQAMNRGEVFRHPMGGSVFNFEKSPHGNAVIEEVFQDAQKGIIVDELPEEIRPWANFFLHWRRWPIESAYSDSRTYFLPADTRIPDHNIWCHNSVVSALAGSRYSGMRPAFLLFQLGPVQEYISQARSTRDLWSGSYLLSWLMVQSLKAVSDWVGPDSIIYPSLRGQPLFDLVHRTVLYDQIHFSDGRGSTETLWQRLGLQPNDYLTPTIPNRFLALVPDELGPDIANAAEASLRKELTEIGEECWEWFSEKGHPITEEHRQRFQKQIAAFPQIQWHIEPWKVEQDVQQEVHAFMKLYGPCSPGADALRDLHSLATREIPVEERNQFLFQGNDIKNPAFCWPYYYARAARNFEGRRGLRDFDAWNTDDHRAGTPKDSFSGMAEVVGTESWWEDFHNQKVDPQLRWLFRSQDRLGAMNLLKRVWHRAYLEKVQGLKVRDALSFESVPGLAAGRWRQNLEKEIKEDADVCSRIGSCVSKIDTFSRSLGWEINHRIDPRDIGSWIGGNDPSLFMPETWNIPLELDSDHKAAEIRSILSREKIFNGIPRYYAVVALDGDEMGRWISGEKTPPLIDQFSSEAVQYFSSGESRRLLSARPRPVSPSYHLQLSEALSNFSLYLVRPVVEYFQGQLIYAGGDDVLAMVPVDQLFECMEALKATFQGSAVLLDALVPGLFHVYGSNGGFLELRNPGSGQPTWPLIVPGPRATASMGVAVGHVQTPLQNMIRAAKAAEKHAKQHYQRDAFSMRLFKRSGEILQWGAKWNSSALGSIKNLMMLLSEEIMSNRFPYVFVEKMVPYELDHSRIGALEDIGSFDFYSVIIRELDYSIQRQSKVPRHSGISDFRHFAEQYLKDLCSDIPSSSSIARPLPDFASMFQFAAFLTRGE